MSRLIEYAAKELQRNQQALEWLQDERGITGETAARFSLGWIQHNIYDDKTAWSIEPDGKKLFIPSGLTIPWKDKRVRIRRDNPGDYGRYHVLQGSVSEIFTTGNHYETTAIVVESELDAILLAQEIDRPLHIVALGTAAAKPDAALLEKLSFCPVVLVALDTDNAGAKAARWWLENVGNTWRTLTPSSFGKDITEAYINGMDLDEWLSASLLLYCDEILTKEGN